MLGPSISHPVFFFPKTGVTLNVGPLRNEDGRMVSLDVPGNVVCLCPLLRRESGTDDVLVGLHVAEVTVDDADGLVGVWLRRHYRYCANGVDAVHVGSRGDNDT